MKILERRETVWVRHRGNTYILNLYHKPHGQFWDCFGAGESQTRTKMGRKILDFAVVKKKERKKR